MKTVVFIDGLYLNECWEAVAGGNLDFKRLLNIFRTQTGRELVRCHYACIVPPAHVKDRMRTLLDWLVYNGFTLIEREVASTDDLSRITSVAAAITATALELAPTVGHVTLVAGDDEYVPLVLALKRAGVTVELVSTLEQKRSLVGDKLRRAVDIFTELGEIVDRLEGDERPA